MLERTFDLFKMNIANSCYTLLELLAVNTFFKLRSKQDAVWTSRHFYVIL